MDGWMALIIYMRRGKKWIKRQVIWVGLRGVYQEKIEQYGLQILQVILLGMFNWFCFEG